VPSSDLVLVPRLSMNRNTFTTMRYLTNSTSPGIAGSAWAAPGFNDAAWPAGNYGVGYDTEGAASQLLATTVPSTVHSVYTRVRFDVADPSQVVSMTMGADYDDGWAAWINGVEVYRSPEMPAGVLDWNTAATSHEASNGAVPSYGPAIDVAAAGIPALHAGQNVLAVGVWNRTPSSDLVLVPRLTINAETADNCPSSPNNLQDDLDADQLGDACDNCPATPNLSQTNGDQDGAGDACDCAPADPAAWSTPGEALVRASHVRATGVTTLTWTAPASPGALSVRYDVLRSPDARNFVALGTCVSTDTSGTSATDSASPPADSAFFYIVRTENACPTGGSNAGAGSDGVPRDARTCP
jgi:hypothetical protein